MAVLIVAALELTDSVYRGTRKETGALFHVPHQIFPTLVVDVGWPESHGDIFDDMNRLLIRNEGKTKVAIIVRMTKHSSLRVSGVVELYRLDPQGIPKLEQSELLLPTPTGDPSQPINIRLGELCAGQVGPRRDPDAILPLSIRELRVHATTCPANEGYSPA